MPGEREKVLRYFAASGDSEIASQLLERAEGARKCARYKLTSFLDPHELNVAEIITANLGGLRLTSCGGFKEAERVQVAFVAEDFLGEVVYELKAYQITWDKTYYTLTHRDVLGALMGLGCKREVFGDIVLNEAGAQIVALSSFEQYLLSNLTCVGAAPVKVTEIDLTALTEREVKVKTIQATVAALRLDAVAAAGYGTSRSRMAEEIKTQNVKINFVDAKSAAQTVKEGDKISFRGRGRVEVAEVRGTTKKGRICVTLKRYL